MQFKDKQRINLFMSPNIIKRTKAQALKEGMPLSSFIEKTLDKVVPRTIEISVKK